MRASWRWVATRRRPSRWCRTGNCRPGPALPFLFVGALLAGGLLAALVGLAVGIPTLRLRGDYLAIVTLGFGEIIRVIFQNMESVGAASGLSGIPEKTTLFWASAWRR